MHAVVKTVGKVEGVDPIERSSQSNAQRSALDPNAGPTAVGANRLTVSEPTAFGRSNLAGSNDSTANPTVQLQLDQHLEFRIPTVVGIQQASATAGSNCAGFRSNA